MNRRYRSAIIGAGNIAARYDSPGETNVLTHAHAMEISERLHCVGFYDVDRTRAEEAARKWGLAAFSNLEDLRPHEVEVFVVSAPDAEHFDLLTKLLDFSPRLVLCEKPLTTRISDSQSVVEAYQKKAIGLAVNYQRRYDPAVVALRSAMTGGDLGEFLGGNILYSKGILHNGSHAVDLVRYVFGEVQGVISTGRVYDGLPTDPTVSGSLFLPNGQVQLVAGDERRFSVFEIDLVFSEGRYRFIRSGLALEKYEVRDDPVFPGHRELAVSRTEQTGLAQALSLVMDGLVDYLDSGGELRIDASRVLRTQEVCEALATAPPNQYVSLEHTR